MTIGGNTYTDITAVYKVHGPFIFYPLRIENDSAIIENNNISLYPNPSDGSFYLQLTGTENEQGLIQLFDLRGRELLKGELVLTPENPARIKLPDSVSDGIYILAFRNKHLNTYFKIIVNKP